MSAPREKPTLQDAVHSMEKDPTLTDQEKLLISSLMYSISRKTEEWIEYSSTSQEITIRTEVICGQQLNKSRTGISRIVDIIIEKNGSDLPRCSFLLTKNQNGNYYQMIGGTRYS